ncbi:MAG: dihydroorotase [Planctomycetota bacterium]
MGESVLIKGGTVCDPSQGIHDQRDVLILDGRVAEIAPGIDESKAAGGEVIDAAGLVVSPGFVELRAHFREPGGESAETIETGALAAAHGGYTTVLCAPNTSTVIDDPSLVRFITARAAQACGVRIRPVAAATRGLEGTELTDFASLLESGAVAFSDADHSIANAATLRRALESAGDLGAVVIEQCENRELTGSGVMHEGVVALRLGLHGIPRMSESTQVARDAAIAHAAGGRLHISQLSCADSVEVVRDAKRRGTPITAEVSPHHLTMIDEAVAGAGYGYNTSAKVRPPLRQESDRKALVEGLEDGTIDCIATCHAPHTEASKNTVFDQAPFGIIGLESAFPVLYTQFVRSGRWTLDFLIEKLTIAPARVLNLEVGSLVTGAPGDVVMLRLGQPSVFDESALASKSKNCPWLGETMMAAIERTIVGGQCVYGAHDVLSGGVA